MKQKKRLISPLVPKNERAKIKSEKEDKLKENRPCFVVVDGKVFYESAKPL